jgi:DNA-binding phage protein
MPRVGLRRKSLYRQLSRHNTPNFARLNPKTAFAIHRKEVKEHRERNLC